MESRCVAEEGGLEGIASALGEIQDLVRISSEQEQWFEEKLAYISQQVHTVSAQTLSLKRDVEKMGDEMEILKSGMKIEEMEALENQVDELCRESTYASERLTILESVSLQGGLSMIAVYVEQAMCSYVLPDVFMNDQGASLHDLLNMLNKNSEDIHIPLDPNEHDREEILRDARKRWAVMCKDFKLPADWKTRTGGWSVYDCTVPGDIRAIEVLKRTVVSVNFPNPISLKYAEENVDSMKDDMPLWQFKLVTGFIGSIREKMIKSGLHHDYLILD